MRGHYRSSKPLGLARLKRVAAVKPKLIPTRLRLKALLGKGIRASGKLLAAAETSCRARRKLAAANIGVRYRLTFANIVDDKASRVCDCLKAPSFSAGDELQWTLEMVDKRSYIEGGRRPCGRHGCRHVHNGKRKHKAEKKVGHRHRLAVDEIRTLVRKSLFQRQDGGRGVLLLCTRILATRCFAQQCVLRTCCVTACTNMAACKKFKSAT